jgi:hypothetical protein
MPPIPRGAFATAAVVVLLLSNPAPATVVPRLDLPDLVHSAELILHGRIVRHWSDWDQAHQFIWTRYLLEVQEALKGHPSASIAIAEPGGSADGTMMKVSGVPEYYDGEEVIVFLQRTPIGYWRCYGWGQGKYTVTHSADGLKRIRTSLLGLAFMDRPGGQRPAAKLPLNRLNGITLEEFKRLVLTEAKR